MDATSGAVVPGESIESSAESSAITTPSGGTGQTSVQRTVRHRQVGGPDDDKRVTMSEHSQIESEVAEETGEQSAASRSVQQFDKLSDEVKKLEGGGVEKSQEAFCKVNERQEAESRRQIVGGEETSKISSVSKQESKQTSSVADLGGGRSGTSKSSVSKSSHVSEEVCETSSSSSSGRRIPDSGISAKRLTNRSTSLQSDDLSGYRSSERTKDIRSEDIQSDRTASSAKSTTSSTNRERGGILQELQRLLDEEDKYETALRAIRKENADNSFAKRSQQIRKEVDDIVANFFDRKRERRSDRSTFFDSATKRADRLVQEFTREDDDPWRGEEERWRRQRELRQKESDDFFQNAVKKAECLVHEMRDRKESRRRDEEDIFSRYQKEIDAFFNEGRRERDLGLRDRDFGLSSPLRRSQDAIDEFFSSSRQSAASRRSNLRNCSSFADDLIRDFFSDDFDTSSTRRYSDRGADSWTPHRERNDSTHIDIDEVLSQASTIRDDRGTRRPDIDIEELSSSTAAGSRADRSRSAKSAKQAAGSSRLVDDIVREFIADDFEDEDTLRSDRPRPDRQHSSGSTGTADEACSIRSEIGSRMSEINEEIRAATEAQTEERRRAAEERKKRLEEEREKHRLAMEEQSRQTRSDIGEKLEEKATDQKRDFKTDSYKESAPIKDDLSHEINVKNQQMLRENQNTSCGETISESASSQTSVRETHSTKGNIESHSSAQESVQSSSSRQESNKNIEHQPSPPRDAQMGSTQIKSESYSKSVTEESHSTRDSSTKAQTPTKTTTESHTEAEERREETKSDQDGEKSAATEAEKAEESTGVNAEAAAAALKRAEELLFGFVPDWEREEQKWSRVRTDRIADVGHRRQMDELMSDYKPLRYHKEDDARTKQKLERKTEEYENRIGGDVWRNLSAEPKFGRSRGGAADSVLSDLRAAREQQAMSTSSHRSQMQSRRAEREEAASARDREPVSADSSAATRRSKLEEYRSFKNELWDEK